MLDLDAPIIPSVSAAGYRIGQPVDEVLRHDGDRFAREDIRGWNGQLPGEYKLCSEDVNLVIEDGLLSVILVQGQYRGAVFGRLRLGMTIDDAERLIGPVAEDAEDNLSVRGLRGLVFDTDWRPERFIDELDFTWPDLRNSRITWMSVFVETHPNPWGDTHWRIPADNC